MTSAVLVLALYFPLTTLAKTTSAIILLVFAAVNLALWRIKRDDPDPYGAEPRFPRWLPLVSFIVTISVLLFQGPLLCCNWLDGGKTGGRVMGHVRHSKKHGATRLPAASTGCQRRPSEVPFWQAIFEAARHPGKPLAVLQKILIP